MSFTHTSLFKGQQTFVVHWARPLTPAIVTRTSEEREHNARDSVLLKFRSDCSFRCFSSSLDFEWIIHPFNSIYGLTHCVEVWRSSWKTRRSRSSNRRFTVIWDRASRRSCENFVRQFLQHVSVAIRTRYGKEVTRLMGEMIWHLISNLALTMSLFKVMKNN